MKTCRGFFTRIRPILPRVQGLESLSGLARISLVATVQGANRRGGKTVGGSDYLRPGVQVPYGCFQKIGGTPKWMVYNGKPY